MSKLPFACLLDLRNLCLGSLDRLRRSDGSRVRSFRRRELLADLRRGSPGLLHPALLLGLYLGSQLAGEGVQVSLLLGLDPLEAFLSGFDLVGVRLFVDSVIVRLEGGTLVRPQFCQGFQGTADFWLLRLRLLGLDRLLRLRLLDHLRLLRLRLLDCHGLRLRLGLRLSGRPIHGPGYGSDRDDEGKKYNDCDNACSR